MASRELEVVHSPQVETPPSRGPLSAFLDRLIGPFHRGEAPERKPAMGFYTDTTVCIGCKACEVACKQWNQLPADGFAWTGNSYDNTGELSATSWRHVKFVEQFADNQPPEPTGNGRASLDVLPGQPHDGRWLSVEAKCRNDGVVAAEIRLAYRLEPTGSAAIVPGASGTTGETWGETRDDEGRGTGTGQGEPRRTVLTHSDLQTILPHRHPMLLVDAITAIDSGLRIVGIKNVTGNEPCFARLDGAVVPASYAYPCSLIIESFGQVAGVLVNVSGPRSRASREALMLFASISGCRFADLDVHPGETLEHRVHLTRDLSDVVILGGEVWMGRRRIAAIDRVVMAFRPPQALPPRAHHLDACGRTGSA